MITEKDIERYQQGQDILKAINKRFGTNYNGFIFNDNTLYLKGDNYASNWI